MSLKNLVNKAVAQDPPSKKLSAFGGLVNTANKSPMYEPFKPGVRNYGQDLTKTDYLENDFSFLGPHDSGELQALRQPWLVKTASMIGRTANSFLGNVAEIPGFIVGAGMAGANEVFGDGEGSLDLMVNNWWSRKIKQEQEWFNNEAMPVYVKKAVEEGNLWDNITSMDFWATEGADGIAFMAAALVPGAGLKALGTGTKLAAAMGKTKAGLGFLKKANDASKALGLVDLAGATDVLSATLVNTLYEAGKESQGGMEAYMTMLDQKLGTREIDETQYAELKKLKSEQGSKIFTDNFGILLVPNLLMSKGLFGKFAPDKELKAFKTSKTGKILPEIQGGIGKNIGDYAKLIPQMTAQEGFLEEGFQMTSEKYRTEDFLNKKLGNESKNFFDRYMDVIGSTEGQKAIFLGGFLGSFAGGIGTYRGKKAKNKQQDALLNILNNGTSLHELSVNGIYKKEDGEYVLDEEGNRVKDDRVLGDLATAATDIQELSERRAKAKKDGNQTAEKFYDNEINTNIIKSFIKAGTEGISLLKNYLENSTGIDAMLESYNENREEKLTKSDLVNEVVNKAKNLEETYKDFKDYGTYYTHLNNFKGDPELNGFANKVENAYVAFNSRDAFFDESISELETRINKRKEKALLNQAAINKTKVRAKLAEEGVIAGEEIDIDDYTKKVLEDWQYTAMLAELEELKDLKANNLKNLKDLQDPELQKGAFLEYKKDIAEQEAKIEEEEDKKVTKIAKDIEKAKSEAAIEAALGKDKEISESSKEFLEEKAAKKKAELKAKEKTRAKNTAKKIKDETLTAEKDSEAKKFNTSTQGSTEGGENVEGSTDENVELNKKQEKAKAEFVHTDVPLQDFYEEENSPFREWQENPESGKPGDNVEFRIAEEYQPEQTKALLEELNTQGVTDNVLENLPINITVAPGVFVPINGKTDTDVWTLIDKPFRQKLLQAYVDNGNSFEGLSTEVAFKYGGQLQMDTREEGERAENKLNTLKGFENIDDIEIITPTDEMGSTMNDRGVEDNFENSLLSSKENEDSKMGKIYMVVKAADGKKFPLRVNVRHLNQKEAEIVADIYVKMLTTRAKMNSPITELGDDFVKEIAKKHRKVLPILMKDKSMHIEEVKIKDVLNFFVFRGTSNSPNQLVYDKLGKLSLGDGSTFYTSENAAENRDNIVDWLKANKRHHVRFTKDGRTRVGLANKTYKNYLISEGILHTNAVAGSSLFKGKQTDTADRQGAFTFIKNDIKKNGKPLKNSKKSTNNIRKSNKKVVSSPSTKKSAKGLLGALKNKKSNKEAPETEC